MSRGLKLECNECLSSIGVDPKTGICNTCLSNFKRYKYYCENCDEYFSLEETVQASQVYEEVVLACARCGMELR